MNKRQIKKKYKRINGKNPPKYFTVAQMRKCSTNSRFSNKFRILLYAVENSAKKIGIAISGLVKMANKAQAAKMLNADLIEQAKHESDAEIKADLLLRALGMELGESRANYMEKLLNE